MSEDKFYPTIKINVTSGVEYVKREDKYMWHVSMHIGGPDDIGNIESELFESKQACTHNFLSRFEESVSKLANNLMSDT